MNSPEKTGFRISLKHRALRQVTRLALELAYRIELSQEDRLHIFALQEHLDAGSSAVVIFNHTCLDDPFILLARMYGLIGNSIRDIGMPVAMKHADPNRYSRDAAVVRFIQSELGIKLVPVVQPEDKSFYPEEVERLQWIKFGRMAVKMLRKPGGVVILAPEGTRSEDGKVNQVEPGIEHFGNYGPLVQFLPVGIIPFGKMDRELNIGSRFALRFAEPFKVSEIRQEDIPEGLRLADAMMLRVTELLPPEMRGFYADYL